MKKLGPAAHLRKVTRARRFPWLVVVESGDDGRVHAHVLVRPGDVFSAERGWSHGFTCVRFGDFSDYVSKGFASVPPGERRYEVARGFAPVAVESMHDSYDDAVADLTREHGDDLDILEAPHRPADPPAWAVLRWRQPPGRAA